MYLCADVTAASRMLELFGEVGGDFSEYFSSRYDFQKIDKVKSYREKIVLKTF